MNEIHETIHPASSDSSIPTVSTVPAVPAPPEVAPAPAAAEPAVSRQDIVRAVGIRQSIAILDRIRSTAIHGGLVCALFPFIDAYNGIYDTAMGKGWIRQSLGHHPRPGGPGHLGKHPQRRPQESRRDGGPADEYARFGSSRPPR